MGRNTTIPTLNLVERRNGRRGRTRDGHPSRSLSEFRSPPSSLNKKRKPEDDRRVTEEGNRKIRTLTVGSVVRRSDTVVVREGHRRRLRPNVTGVLVGVVEDGVSTVDRSSRRNLQT